MFNFQSLFRNHFFGMIFVCFNIFFCFPSALDIAYDLYTSADNMLDSAKDNPDNKCYCPGNEYCPPKGLQNISPCQYGKF